MLTDVVPALALAVEPAEPGVLERPPRDPEAPLLGREDRRRLGRAGLSMAAASLAAFALAGPIGASPKAMAFTSLVTAQLLHTGACRASTSLPNPYLRRALVGSFALQLGALAVPPVAAALGIAGTPALPLVIAAAIGAVPAALRSRGAWGPDEIVIERAAEARAALPVHPEGEERSP
jgi:Ca2+-transporting ATPase